MSLPKTRKGVTRLFAALAVLFVPTLVVATRQVATMDSPAFVRVETLASALKTPASVALDPDSGTIFVADAGHHQIRTIAVDGTVSVLAGSGAPGDRDGAGATASFRQPGALAYDAANDLLYVADTGNHVIRRIDAAGVVTTIAGSGRPDRADGVGQAAGFQLPAGLAFHGGALYVADTGNHLIRRVDANFGVSTVAGGGHPGSADGDASTALFASPEAVAVDANGVIWVADTGNHIIRRIASGIVSTVAGSKPGFVDGSGAAAKFHEPAGIAVTSWGDVLVSDRKNDAIRLVTASGAVSTIAGGAKGLVDGAPQVAKFNAPAGITFAGALLIADGGNDAVRAMYAEARVEAVEPSTGPAAGGNGVTITGSSFVGGRTTVKFGDGAATNVRVLSPSTLTCTVPAGTMGAVDVRVTTPAGTAVLDDAYAYLEPPTVTAIQPNRGTTAGGYVVAIRGTAFIAGQTTVKFGANAATDVVVADSTNASARVPAGAPGTVGVTVSTPVGDYTMAGTFTYVPPPAIASFEPASGGPGTSVIINGFDFDPVAAGNTVRFGSLTAQVVSATASQIQAVVPPGAVTAKISVETIGGVAQSVAPFVVRVLSAVSVAPQTASLEPGQTAALTATASYSDGTTVDVTATAAWTTADASVATVSAAGIVTAQAQGSTSITAAYNGLSAQSAITVTRPGSIVLPPDPASIAPPLDGSIVTEFGDAIRFL